MLRKAEICPAPVLQQVPIEIEEDLTLEVKPVKILDRSSQIEEEMWKRRQR
jgi:hypothetical protein